MKVILYNYAWPARFLFMYICSISLRAVIYNFAYIFAKHYTSGATHLLARNSVYDYLSSRRSEGSEGVVELIRLAEIRHFRACG